MFLKKYFIYGSVAVFVLGFGESQKLNAQVKIGFVDSQKILSSYMPAVEAQRELDTKNEEWDKELQEMNNELNKLQEELDQRSLLLSEAKKKEMAQEIESKILEIQQYQTSKWGDNGEFFRVRETSMRSIYDTINQAISTVADEEGYDFILDSAAGNILYAKTQFNITDQVLEELERGTSEEEMYMRGNY